MYSYFDKKLEKLLKLKEISEISKEDFHRIVCDLRILIVDCENITMKIDEKTITANKGDIFILNNKNRFSCDGKCVFIDLVGAYAAEAYNLLARENSLILSGFDFEPILELCKRFFLVSELNSNEYSLSSFGFQIILTLFKCINAGKSKNYPLIISSALEIIDTEYAFLLGIDDLADRLSVSKNHLVREFTKHLKISPGKYLTNVRIENAKFLLLDSSLNLDYIATATGFSCANYFSKVFKKTTGQTAGEFVLANSHVSKTLDPKIFI